MKGKIHSVLDQKEAYFTSAFGRNEDEKRRKAKTTLKYAKRAANKLTLEQFNASLPKTLKGTGHGPNCER